MLLIHKRKGFHVEGRAVPDKTSVEIREDKVMHARVTYCTMASGFEGSSLSAFSNAFRACKRVKQGVCVSVRVCVCLCYGTVHPLPLLFVFSKFCPSIIVLESVKAINIPVC